jgi:hypothetical protein
MENRSLPRAQRGMDAGYYWHFSKRNLTFRLPRFNCGMVLLQRHKYGCLPDTNSLEKAERCTVRHFVPR